MTLKAQLLAHLMKNPPECEREMSGLVASLKAPPHQIRLCLSELIAEGFVKVTGNGKRHVWACVPARSWHIEYEIPPLRAIYTAMANVDSEAAARELVAKEQPLWRIRKIIPIYP